MSVKVINKRFYSLTNVCTCILVSVSERSRMRFLSKKKGQQTTLHSSNLSSNACLLCRHHFCVHSIKITTENTNNENTKCFVVVIFEEFTILSDFCCVKFGMIIEQFIC